MTSSPEYSIEMKPAVKEHVYVQLRGRYFTFFRQNGMEIEYNEAEQEVMHCLETAPINRSVPETNVHRCRFNKYEMKMFSYIFNTEVRAYFFQDDKGGYPTKSLLRKG